MSYVTFLDKNLYRKKEKALSRYFRKCYKHLMFDVIPTLRKDGKQEGIYELELPIEELFKRVYGPMVLKFSVKKDVAIIEDIEPNDILISCFAKDLPTYKGIPYDSKKDFEKLKLMEGILCHEKK